MFLRQQSQPLYHCSITPTITTTTVIEQDRKPPPPSTQDRKRSELVHKEEKSFWRSWFGFGSTGYDFDSDSDDEKRKKTDSKSNETNSIRPHGPKLSTRKSSAERQTNFNAPTEEERTEAKAAKINRSAIVRTIR